MDVASGPGNFSWEVGNYATLTETVLFEVILMFSDTFRAVKILTLKRS